MIESVLLFKLDLYTFDKDEQMGRETYHEVCEVYAQILDKLTVNFVKGKCNKLSKEADEIAKVQAKHGKSAWFAKLRWRVYEYGSSASTRCVARPLPE